MTIKATLRARRRRRRILWVSLLAVLVAVLFVVYFIAAASGNPYESYIGKPVSSTILQQVTGVTDATLSSVGLPSGVSPPVSISGSSLTSGGKPEVLYIGGDFCPYCAIQRWSLIIALSHFGNFSGLEYMLSSATDVNPNSPTFTFKNATFTSKYISFVGVEQYGRGGTSDVIQPMTAAQQSLLTQYDTCASTGQSNGIPFVDIANQYAVNCGAQANLPCPGSLCLSGKNWTEIASQLNNPNDNIGRLLVGAANTLITAICNVDGGQPGSVCSQSYATLPISYQTAGGATSLTSLVVPSPSRLEA